MYAVVLSSGRRVLYACLYIYVQRQELGSVSFFSLCVKSSLVIFISAMRRSLVLVAVVISLFRSPVTF